MKRFTEITFSTYSHLAPALINGDDSGLSEENGDFLLLQEIELWLVKENAYVVNCSEENEFSWKPDFGILGGDILTFTALVRNN